jgi:hypothetical protein
MNIYSLGYKYKEVIFVRDSDANFIDVFVLQEDLQIYSARTGLSDMISLMPGQFLNVFDVNSMGMLV